MRALLSLLFCLVAVTAHAQGFEMAPAPELKKVDFLLGTFKGSEVFNFGQEIKSTSTIKGARALGGHYIQSLHHYRLEGGAEVHGMMLLTYDAQNKRYVGSWFDHGTPEAMVMRGSFEGDKLVMLSDPVAMGLGQAKTVTRSTWWIKEGKVYFTLDTKQGETWSRMITGEYTKG